ncbi:hypothetical protein GN244_ATG15036 [Phytophthora infestans]|uniref:Uncharacterized protein n=1 Tax=Phytophthora infestans TaxID=4787 RepID=A0A833W7Y7_PHYIN|nr:hypothetical protein GN244_ATG15036 [Phytophthora infestans]KAI9982366.1 hypothetical protein PInf_008303 [Phytophthora infestans]
MGLKRSLRAEKATEELNDEDEDRGKVSAFLTKVGGWVNRKKKIDPKIAAKADDLKKSPNIGPKVLAKADSRVLAGTESKVLTRVDSKAMKNTVPAVPKELTAVNSKMSKEGKEVMKKLDGLRIRV